MHKSGKTHTARRYDTVNKQSASKAGFSGSNTQKLDASLGDKVRAPGKSPTVLLPHPRPEAAL